MEPWPWDAVWPWEAAGAAGADGGAVNSGVVGAGDAGAGRGAGFGPGVGRGPEAAGAAGAAGCSAAAGFGAGGRGAAGRAACAGEGAAGRAGAALRAGAGLPPPLPCWRASVSLRTTGASIVEEAERTNSPSSWSLAMTTLLSTPNSLASSYTRTLATSLLLGPGCGRTVATSWAYSSRAHRVLIAISTYFQLAGYLGRTGVPRDASYGVACSATVCLLDVLAQRLYVECSRGAQRPREHPAAYRLVETDQGGVDVRTPAGQRTARIRDACVLDRHDAQQIGLGRSLPATHTGSFRACAGVRPARHS